MAEQSTTTLLVKADAGPLTRDDYFYVVQGSGSNRDRKVKFQNLASAIIYTAVYNATSSNKTAYADIAAMIDAGADVILLYTYSVPNGSVILRLVNSSPSILFSGISEGYEYNVSVNVNDEWLIQKRKIVEVFSTSSSYNTSYAALQSAVNNGTEVWFYHATAGMMHFEYYDSHVGYVFTNAKNKTFYKVHVTKSGEDGFAVEVESSIATTYSGSAVGSLEKPVYLKADGTFEPISSLNMSSGSAGGGHALVLDSNGLAFTDAVATGEEAYIKLNTSNHIEMKTHTFRAVNIVMGKLQTSVIDGNDGEGVWLCSKHGNNQNLTSINATSGTFIVVVNDSDSSCNVSYRMDAMVRLDPGEVSIFFRYNGAWCKFVYTSPV